MSPVGVPDANNPMRARRGMWTLKQYQASFQQMFPDVGDVTLLYDELSDLLADLMHSCDTYGVVFNDALDSARRNYDAEVDGDDFTSADTRVCDVCENIPGDGVLTEVMLLDGEDRRQPYEIQHVCGHCYESRVNAPGWGWANDYYAASAYRKSRSGWTYEEGA